MKVLTTILLSLLFPLMLQAQPFAQRWMSHPLGGTTQHVWFRQNITLNDQPCWAELNVCTTGRIDIYVNERNISTDVLIPHREGNSHEAINTSFDVTPFLHKGDNSIAIWYAPTTPMATDRQVAVRLNGHYTDGTEFSLRSDSGWICRYANRQTTASGEQIDADSYRMKWCSDDIDWALWSPVRISNDGVGAIDRQFDDDYVADKVVRIKNQSFFDVEKNAVYYEFGSSFNGWIRVTLRSTRRGQRFTIDNLSYTCKGQTDEQAYHKFTSGSHRRVCIKGDRYFKPEQIFSVEAIEIAPYKHTFLP